MYGAKVRYSLGINVNTPFFQVPTLEFGHGAGARPCTQAQTWAPGSCAHNFCKFRAVHCFVLGAKLMFQNSV